VLTQLIFLETFITFRHEYFKCSIFLVCSLLFYLFPYVQNKGIVKHLDQTLYDETFLKSCRIDRIESMFINYELLGVKKITSLEVIPASA
jgi:hypothetical protein